MYCSPSLQYLIVNPHDWIKNSQKSLSFTLYATDYPHFWRKSHVCSLLGPQSRENPSYLPYCMNQIPTPIRALSQKISLQVNLQISPKWHGILKQVAIRIHLPKISLCLWTLVFFFFFLKKINLLIPLCTFNFLIQKWCLKESYIFSNFPMTWTHKKYYSIMWISFVFSLYSHCHAKKLFSNATTLSIWKPPESHIRKKWKLRSKKN